MTLKFKRNLPIVVLLVGILSILALTMGSQQVVSYTVNMDAIQAVQASDIRLAMAGLFGVQP
jgi:hypothetical protein